MEPFCKYASQSCLSDCIFEQCRARKPFDPCKLWSFTNKYFLVQQSEIHEHDHDEQEEDGEAGKNEDADMSTKNGCPEVVF